MARKDIQMLLKSLTALTLATVAGLALSLDASATSRFTVDNVTDRQGGL